MIVFRLIPLLDNIKKVLLITIGNITVNLNLKIKNIKILLNFCGNILLLQENILNVNEAIN